MSCQRFSPRPVLSAVLAAGTIAVFGTQSAAMTVQTDYRKLDGVRADFGSGFHSLGSPTGNGVVLWDYAPSGLGIIATARVKGTLYWDALFSAGCARLTITYKDYSGHTITTNTATLCAPGGDANNSANQKAVDVSFGDQNLASIVISANEVQNGTVLSGASTSSASPPARGYPVKIDSGNADFGSGTHAFGSPTGNANVTINRAFPGGLLNSTVTGTLYWDSLLSPGCARAIVNFQDGTGNTVFSRVNDACGPGGDANSASNQTAIDDYDLDGMWQVQLRIGSLAGTSFVGVTNQTFNFNGQVGTFELQPPVSEVAVNQLYLYGFTWTVPEPLTWHDLQALQLRIRDDADTILWLRWDQMSNTFAVFNADAAMFGRGFAPGSHARLETGDAAVLLDRTSVAVVNSALGNGPTSPAVTLNLALRFKPSTAGRTFYVDVAASDEGGHEDPFVVAGQLTVNPQHGR